MKRAFIDSDKAKLTLVSKTHRDEFTLGNTMTNGTNGKDS